MKSKLIMKSKYISTLYLMIFSIGMGVISAQNDTIYNDYHPLVQECLI